MKKFTSKNDIFWIYLPDNWDEYDDGAENTHAFFDSASEKWKGNLRITHLFWTHPNPEKDPATTFMKNELADNKGAGKVKLGDWEFVRYKKHAVQENEYYTLYYWATGIRNDLFICSFTIYKKEENTRSNKAELKIIEDILSSIHIL